MAATNMKPGSNYVIEDEIQLKKFLDIFIEAEKEEGIVDMADPE